MGVRPRIPTAVVAAVVALALLAAGCGDEDSPTPSATTGAPATARPSTTSTTAVAASTTTVFTTPTAVPTIVEDVLRGENEADRYTYELKFPKLQGLADAAAQDAVNAGIRAEVTAAVDEFVAGAEELGAPAPAVADQRSALTGTYEVSRLDEGLASVRVRVSRFFAGAAHPGAVMLTFNHDLRTGARLTLTDLFTPGSPYLDKLSELSRQLLAAQPGFADVADFVQRGTGPTAENFAGWTLTDADLVITFAEYQVAPYAFGMPHVSIPFASLRLLLDPDGPLAIRN